MKNYTPLNLKIAHTATTLIKQVGKNHYLFIFLKMPLKNDFFIVQYSKLQHFSCRVGAMSEFVCQ